MDLSSTIANLSLILFYVICRVDKDRSGAISTNELQQALSNGKRKLIEVL